MRKFFRDPVLWIVAGVIFVASLFSSLGKDGGAELPASSSPDEVEAIAVRDRIKEHLDANFSQTSWYPYIVDLKVELSRDRARLEVSTLMSDRAMADQVCRILWGNYVGMTGREDLTVSIRGDRGVGAYCGV